MTHHVVLVERPVARLLPKVRIVHAVRLLVEYSACLEGAFDSLGRDDLLIASLPVLFLDIRLEGVVDPRTVGQPEGAARGEGVEEEELLLHSEPPVVALGRLLEELTRRKTIGSATGAGIHTFLCSAIRFLSASLC